MAERKYEESSTVVGCYGRKAQVSPQGAIPYLLLFSHSKGAKRALRHGQRPFIASRLLPIRNAAVVSIASTLIFVGRWVATSMVSRAFGAELQSQTDFCPPLVRLDTQTLTRDMERSPRGRGES